MLCVWRKPICISKSVLLDKNWWLLIYLKSEVLFPTTIFLFPHMIFCVVFPIFSKFFKTNQIIVLEFFTVRVEYIVFEQSNANSCSQFLVPFHLIDSEDLVQNTYGSLSDFPYLHCWLSFLDCCLEVSADLFIIVLKPSVGKKDEIWYFILQVKKP